MHKLTVIVLALAGLISCTTGGGLEQIELAESCTTSDPTCEAAGLDAPLAVGANVDLDIDLQSAGNAVPTVNLESARTDILSVDGTSVWGEAAGVSAILFTAADDPDVVVDFVHIWVEQPTRLALKREETDAFISAEMTEDIQLLVGETITVTVIPHAGDQALLGDGEVVWTIEGDAVKGLSAGYPQTRRLYASEAGNSSISVSSLGLTVALNLEVIQ